MATVFRPAWYRCICGLGGLTAWPQSLDQHGARCICGLGGLTAWPQSLDQHGVGVYVV